MKIPLLRPAFAVLAFVLTASLSAQTWVGGTSSKWEDAANWDPAAVPDGTGVTATFTAAGLPASGPANLTLSGDHTLAAIRYAPDTRALSLFVENSTGPASLALAGEGLRNETAGTQSLWLASPDFNGTDPVTLTFLNQATVTGNVRLNAIGSDRLIAFRDQSSAGSAEFSAYVVDFYDESTAGASVFTQSMGAQVTFHDSATAGSARLPGYYGTVTFADSSSAGNARVERPDGPGTSAQVIFRDQARAGSATFFVTDLGFTGESSAENAVLNNSGAQVYSSHGAYATYFSNLAFRDQASAGSATITNNALGVLTVTDAATTAHATINNTGTATWSGQASFGSARLVAGSGTYYGIGGYNEQAPTVTTGGVSFKDQAQGGDGTIEIAAAGAWLDFSGLYTGTGIAGRALLDSATGDVVPDDARVISFGSIRNTVAGGAIYLGGTTLRVGGDNSDATLSARIRDVGGAYGSASRERLHGGTLIKAGTGTLTISNPDNSYGSTLITNGTLRLDGGRISNATIAAAGRLTGTGTIQGALHNSGVISPGNSPGTITVQGNYTQTSTGSLNIEFASATSFDRLAISGTAALDGTLTLSLAGSLAPVGSGSYAFLTASAISGQFATVNAPVSTAALSSQLVYGTNGVSLQITQKPFAGFGTGAPATALGGFLDDTLAGATGDYRALIAGLNAFATTAEIETALTALAPDRYGTLAENAFFSALAHQAATDRRLAATRENPARGFTAFFEAGQQKTDFDAVAGLPAASGTLRGGTAGALWQNQGFSLGGSLTRESGDLDLDEIGSRAEIEGTAPAAFLQYAAGRFFVNARAAFSKDDYELSRRIVYTGRDDTALATTSGSRQDFGLNAGWVYRQDSWSLTPQAGLLASRWQIDGFTETGATGANLRIPDQSIRSLRSRVGFDLAARGRSFAPRLTVTWLHEFEDDRSLEASFAGAGGSSYAAPGRPAESDVVQASLGFDWYVGPHAVLYATAGGAWGGDSALTADLSAGFRWQF